MRTSTIGNLRLPRPNPHLLCEDGGVRANPVQIPNRTAKLVARVRWERAKQRARVRMVRSQQLKVLQLYAELGGDRDAVLAECGEGEEMRQVWVELLEEIEQ